MILLIASLVMVSGVSFAKEEKKAERNLSSTPKVVSEAATKMKNSDVKTVITKVNNTEGNPCLSQGISYDVELKVKKAVWNGITSKVEYSWDTIKHINVSDRGEVMEVCAE